MARTLSWIDRIVPMARTVAGSVRSHYSRKDLQRLFEIQPRSAQNLMAAMPVVSIGNSHLVEKETLSTFLQLLNEAEDATIAFALLRSRGARPLNRKLRALSLREIAADLNATPENLILNPGEMTVRFETVDQLAEVMVYIAALLQEHLDEFAARYELPQKPLSKGVYLEEQICLDAEYVREWSANEESNKV